jgi:hypothetical protein
MSRSRRIFKLIQPQVPGTVLCGDHLIITPTTGIARGFFLDTTSRKDHMMLMRTVMPLHRPFAHSSFNYSQSIEGDCGGLFHIDKQDYGASAAVVLQKLKPHVEPLRKIQTTQDFMGHVAWMSGNRMLPFRTDLGINHYLLGNIQEALAIFRQLQIDLDEHSPATQKNYRPVIQQVMHFLENDPVGLHAVIESWRDENIEKLGLSASVAAPALRLVR